MGEEVYDIICSYLLDEGYVTTEEAANNIMVNMSEQWRQSILEDAAVIDKQGNRQSDLFTGKPNPNYKRVQKPTPKVSASAPKPTTPPDREEPLW